MRHVDIKSMIIGGLSVALLFSVIGASKQTTQPTAQYQISADGDGLFVLDQQTNQVTYMRRDHQNSVAAPWKADHVFNLSDAVHQKKGAPIEGEGEYK